MFNTLSTPFSLMDSVDIIHLKIGRAPLPTVYGWNGIVPTGPLNTLQTVFGSWMGNRMTPSEYPLQK